MIKSKIRSLPRANSASVISSDARANMQELLCEYGDIPVHCLTLLYKSRFDKILDCISLKIEGGLLKYLERMLGDMINIGTDATGNVYISLNERIYTPDIQSKENISPLLRKRLYERECRGFFNPDSILWRGRLKLLDRRNLTIELSCFEQTKFAHERQVFSVINTVRNMFAKFPRGIAINELHRHFSIDPMLFHAVSPVAMVNDLPELFYKVDRQNQEPLIFDGHIHTYNDLSGNDDSLFTGVNPQDIVEEVIRNGLYQKTLILMRDKGIAGLKINVWARSIERSFYQGANEDEKKEIYKYGALVFFMALARFGLAIISPGKDTKNDLRAFIPRTNSKEVEPIFEKFCKQRSKSCIY